MRCLVLSFYSAYVIIRTTGNHFSCLSYLVALLRQVSPCLCANHYAHLHKCSHSCNWPTYASTYIPRTCVNGFIQCGEDYPLMYNGDLHRWYLKQSYLGGMPNSNIPHQTTVIMMRTYIYFLLKGCLHLWSRLVRTDYGLQDWCRETEGEREDFITILWHQSGWKVTHFFQPINGTSWGYITIAVFGDVAYMSIFVRKKLCAKKTS